MNWQMIVAELMDAFVNGRGFARHAQVYQLAKCFTHADGTVDVTGYMRERARIARLAWIRERIS